jgi:pimeloyl-ACP methyl ester carboxylesterase
MNQLRSAALLGALLASTIVPTVVAGREPYGIGLEGFAYPYPVNMLPLVNDGEQVRMAYMDVASAQPNGRTVVLLHGRNVAHSLGSMLGVRIARAFPDRVDHLVLTAPIGLEDYRFYVPPTPTEKIIEAEDKLTAEGYRRQLETNYSLKLPADQVTPFIEARFNIKGSAEYPRWLRAFVASAQLIYREPVVHEIPLVMRPTLFIMGADDHNAPGKANAPEALRPQMGHNAEHAKALAAQMPNGRAEVIPDTGHLVFLEAPAKYNELVLGFLGSH